MTVVTHTLRDSGNRLATGRPLVVELGGDTGDGEGWRPMPVVMPDGSEVIIPGPFTSDDTGVVTFGDLIPNSLMAVDNTYYRVTLPSGDRHLFQVPDSPDPVQLSDLYTPGGDLLPDAAAILTAAMSGKADKSANLSDLTNVSTARSNLGLGTAATQPSTAFDSSGAAASAQSAAQSYADTNKVSKSANLSDLANTGTARTNLGLGTAATHPSTDFADATATTTALNLKAPIKDAALTGSPTAPTAPAFDSSTKIATTAYADTASTAWGTMYAVDKATRLGDTTFHRVKQLDTQVEYLKTSGFGGWSRTTTGDLVVPEDWAALDPITLTSNVQGVINALTSYQQTNRTATIASTTTAQRAIYTDPVGIGATLFFSPDVEWVFGVDDTMCTDIGQNLRRGAIRLYNGINLKGHRTRMAFWSPGGTGASSLITTGYRPWDETPLRQTGTHQLWGTVSQDQTLWKTGGSPGVSGSPFKTWRYLNTPVAYPTVAVPKSDSNYTITVDQVDGVQRTWASTFGITTQLLASGAAQNPISVGDLVARMQGQNFNDAHEILEWDVCQVVAINGVTTPGYTAQGAGTLTFDKPTNKAAYDPATQLWTSYTPANSGAIAVGVQPGDSRAVPNIAAIAIIKIDPIRWLRHPKITGFDFFTTANPVTGVASAANPNQYIEMNGFSYRPEISDCRFWDALKQGVNHGYVTEPHGHDNEMMGSWTGTLNVAGQLFDFCSTRGGHYTRTVARQPYGQLFQLESNSSVRFDATVIEQTNPVMKTFGGTGTDAQLKSPFQLLGGSRLYLDGLTWSGATNFLIKRNASDNELTTPCTIDGRVSISSTRTSGAALHLKGTEFAPGAEVTVTMPNLAGTSQVTYQFEPSTRTREAGIGWGSATNYALLPPGWPRVSYISVNQASLTGLTSLKLATGLGNTDIELLGSAICTHVTNPATDSVGDGVGSDADRTIVSSTAEFNSQISVDSVVTVHAGNLDGSDWVSGVQQRIDTSNVILYDLPPKPITSGTTVAFDSVLVANKRVQLPAFANRLGAAPTGGAGVGGWVAQKLEQEAAGVQSRLVATWAGGVTPTTGGILLEMETREVRSLPGLPTATFQTSPPAVTDLPTLLTALRLRGVITDNTAGASLVTPAGIGAEASANKGANNGYAPLNSSGVVPTANLPTSLVKYAASMTSVPSAISNTTTATTLWSPTTITTSQLAVGSAFRFEMGGTVTTVATSGAFTFRLRIGGTVIISTTIVLSTTAAQTNLPWWADLSFTVYATGVSGSVGAAGLWQGINAAGATGVQTGFTPPTAATVDLSAGAAVTATIQMATANAGNSFQPLQASLIQLV